MIAQQTDMLNKLEKELEEIKIFLIGNTPREDCCEDTREDSLIDRVRNNTYALDMCINLTAMISEIIKGGK